MSISISLLPIALAARLIMGKENFENWINSNLVRIPTDFLTEFDLIQVVKKSGYDATRFGNSIKTHLGDENSFFFWEFVDGAWTAVFSKRIEQNQIDDFIKTIEAAAGRKVFRSPAVETSTETASFPTNFTDEKLLLKTLLEFGAEPEMQLKGSISCKLGESELFFSRPNTGVPFSVEVRNAPNLDLIYQSLNELDEDYRRCVQTSVYEKVKTRATEKNMAIESEEVLADKTIVITLRVS